MMRSVMLFFLGVYALADQGKVTMWGTNDLLLQGMCEYAGHPVDSITDPVLASYLRAGFHCAIGDSNPNFGIGEHCGKCYRVTSISDNGQHGTPGSRGSAVVMISNKIAEGGTSHFDCAVEGFRAITGAETGIFDMEFEETVCDEISGTPTIMNYGPQNQWYCKMMFQNLGGWGTLSSVNACLQTSDSGEVCNDLQLFQGQTWTGCPQGTGIGMRFELTQVSPTNVPASIECSCGVEWPWPTGLRCNCPTNFIVDAMDMTTTATTTTTTTKTTTTTTVTGFLSTTRTITTTEAGCTYIANDNRAVRFKGTGGDKLKRASYSSVTAYLDDCKAHCTRDPTCLGFVDDPTDRRGRMCKPKKSSLGYHKPSKTLYVKGSGC